MDLLPDASRSPPSAARQKTASVCPLSSCNAAGGLLARSQMIMEWSALPDASRSSASAARQVTGPACSPSLCDQAGGLVARSQMMIELSDAWLCSTVDGSRQAV